MTGQDEVQMDKQVKGGQGPLLSEAGILDICWEQ